MLTKEQFFHLMNMSRKGRREYQKKYGVKVPGLQDPHDIPKHNRGEDNRKVTASESSEDVRATEREMPIHEPTSDAVHR